MTNCPVCNGTMENGKCIHCGHSTQGNSQNYQAQAQAIGSGQGYTYDSNSAYGQPYGHPAPPPQGHYNPAAYRGSYYSYRNRVTALLLCIFLGWFGVHHFYAGKTGMGLLYLFTGGLFGIGWFVDIVLIACGSYRDGYGYLLV